MIRARMPALLLGCAVLSGLASPSRGAGTATGTPPPAAVPGALAGIASPADVDRALSPHFVRRHPSLDIRALGAAWKEIVAAGDRPPVKVIFDTDIGTDIDDALALTFALRRPELDVVAITTSRGEVRQRAAIVSRLLEVLGRPDVPYAPGSPVLFDGSSIRDKPVDQFPFAGPAGDRPRPACDDAQTLFERVIRANWGQVWLVVTGPMTNAAILLRDHPDLARGLKGIACMGGAPGCPFAETNIGNDPAAAAAVCRSGLLKFAGTDAITMRLLLVASDIRRLQQTGTPATRALLELIRLWRTSAPGKPGPVVFDACPYAWLVDPGYFSTVATGLAVNDRGLMTFSSAAPPCAVSTDIRLLAVHRLLMDTLAR